MNPRLRIDVYSHGFSVSHFDEVIHRLLNQFAAQYVERSFMRTGGRRFTQEITKVYATATRDRTTYYFHIGQLQALLHHLKNAGFSGDYVNQVLHPIYRPDTVAFQWKDAARIPRDYQKAVVDFVRIPEPRMKVFTAQMGTGKSFTTLLTMNDLKVRTVLLLRAQYQEQWLKDCVRTFGLKPGEIVRVNGSASLKKLIAMGDAPKALKKLKVAIISNRTYQMYMKSFLQHNGRDVEGYGCDPLHFFEHLKVGLRVVDEVHLDFHFNFLLDCMTHVSKSLSLTATLKGDNPLKNKIADIMFPQASYAPIPEYDSYIRLYSIGYRIRENHRIKFLNLFRQYSQSEYEKSIMHNKGLWQRYVAMILDTVTYQFLDHDLYQEGMKCVVYCGMVEMCKAVQEAAHQRWPGLKIPLFIGGADESAMLAGDIIITNLQMAGTGKDIPNLMVGISTIALSNQQSNEQLVGRLRKPKLWPNIPVRFLFLYNRENPKHTHYLKKRARDLSGKMESVNELVSDFAI